MVIIDHKTGNVLGVSGGLGEKSGANLNRGTQSVRQPGSSIKPIAVISPAIQEKVITAATVYDDVQTQFDGNYKPKDDGNKYRGLINIRDIIAYSQNVPEVKIMKELTPGKSIDYLRNFGITSLKKAEEVKDSKDPNAHDEYLSLAVGGANDGISPLEMAAAYAAIANNGEYITPTFYSKVVDANGNTVLTPNQERKRVISEQNAYIVKTILQEPVKREQQHIVQYLEWMLQLKLVQQMEAKIDGFVVLHLTMQQLVGLVMINQRKFMDLEQTQQDKYGIM